MKLIRFFAVIALLSTGFVFNSCEKEEDPPTPTNELMEGKVWEVTAVYDENDSNITQDVNSYFPTYIHLDDANSLNSTAGPMFMYLVYGKSKFINVTSKFDEVFKYADLQMTEGEWFIDKNKVVDNFTLEVKMRFPTAETFNEVFQLLNVTPPEIVADAIDIIVYHRFKFVNVDINEASPDKMTWRVTGSVEANYYTKDQYGDPVVWVGMSPDLFSHMTIQLDKRAGSLTDLVTAAAANKAAN